MFLKVVGVMWGMAKGLDRINMGSLEGLENEKGLDNKGKVSLKLHSHRGDGFYDGSIYFNHYSIEGKIATGRLIFDHVIPETHPIGKEEFLQKVNEDLAQIDGYLAEAKYGRRFPAFWMHKVDGVLYHNILDEVQSKEAKK